jgi:hypothetical protein
MSSGKLTATTKVQRDDTCDIYNGGSLEFQARLIVE